MILNYQYLQEIKALGENIYSRLKGSGLKLNSLAADMGLSRHLLFYNVFHVKQSFLRDLAHQLTLKAIEIHDLAIWLEQQVDELEQQSKATYKIELRG